MIAHIIKNLKLPIDRLKIRNEFRAAEKCVLTRNRDEMTKHVLEAGAIAERIGSFRKMKRAGQILIQLGQYERAWQLKCHAQSHMNQDIQGLPIWNGQDLSEQIILVHAINSKAIGREIRNCRFIAPLARSAKHCIVITEPRLVPILGRTFPNIEVYARGEPSQLADAIDRADVQATFERLGLFYAKTENEVRQSIVQLKADHQQVMTFKERYKRNPKNATVGISWWSSNGVKDLPDVYDWDKILNLKHTQFVSLQYKYKNIESDINKLGEIGDNKIITDSSVNQFSDLDSYAAQVSAMDAIITVCNATIHIAGDFGIPAVAIRDDRFYGMWPLSGPIHWYPNIRVVYKCGRPWPVVMAEAREQLDHLLSKITKNV